MPAAAPAISQDDLDKAATLAAEIERNLAANAAPPLPPTVTADIPAPVQELDDKPLLPVTSRDVSQTEFARRPDDFYPTERHR